MEATARHESWYVRVILQSENSIGRRQREAFLVSFHSLRDALEYYMDRWYMLRCTDLVHQDKRHQWTIEEPRPRIPLMDGFRKKHHISDWMIEW